MAPQSKAKSTRKLFAIAFKFYVTFRYRLQEREKVFIATVGRVISIEREIKKRCKELILKNETKKIKGNSFTGAIREKYNIDITKLQKFKLGSASKTILYLGCTNNIFAYFG